MKIAITGATGRVGYPIARHLVALGHHVMTLGRRPLPGIAHLPWDLTGGPPELTGTDALVHAAFAHIPNRYFAPAILMARCSFLQRHRHAVSGGLFIYRLVRSTTVIRRAAS